MRDTQKGKFVVFRLSWKPPWCKKSPFSFDAPQSAPQDINFLGVSLHFPFILESYYVWEKRLGEVILHCILNHPTGPKL